MKLIVFGEPSDIVFREIFHSVEHPDSSQILYFFEPDGFKEAVRKNMTPQPIIVFSAKDKLMLCHLAEIKEFISDAILFLIIPDEAHYKVFQDIIPVYPRYVFCKNEDQALFLAMLNKLLKKVKSK